MSEATTLSRRGAFGAAAVGAAALLAKSALAGDAAKDAPLALSSKHAVKPLAFDPKKLKGISEKLIVSHHDNNYASAVKNLNGVESELARVNKDTPAFVVGGLSERALTFRNSATLHEHYFDNLGGDGVLAGAIDKALAESYATRARFEELFRATAMALAGGSGWVVLALDLHRDAMTIGWSSGHSQVLALGAPLLVLDMYEHAYQMDYGAAAAKYIDAFMTNVRWDVVEKRLTRARAAAAALRG